MSYLDYVPKNSEQALAHLVEECGETLAAAGKSQRFGFFSVNPEIPLCEQETNLTWLMREISDLEGAIKEFKARVEYEHG